MEHQEDLIHFTEEDEMPNTTNDHFDEIFGNLDSNNDEFDQIDNELEIDEIKDMKTEVDQRVTSVTKIISSKGDSDEPESYINMDELDYTGIKLLISKSIF